MPVQFGIDVLIDQRLDLLRGRRSGLISNTSGVTGDLINDVDALLREGRVERATEIADDAVLARGLGLSRAEIVGVRTARDWLRSRRLGHRGAGTDVVITDVPQVVCHRP